MNTELLRQQIGQHVQAHKAAGQVLADRYNGSLGELLKAIRKELGLTQAKLAEIFDPNMYPELGSKSGCENIRRWERGEQVPAADKLGNYLNLVNVSLEEKPENAVLIQGGQVLRQFLDVLACPPDQAQIILGRVELHLPVPDDEVEPVEVDEGVFIEHRTPWYDHSPVKVYSGGSYVGRIAEEGITIGPVTLRPTSHGLSIEFPKDWKVNGVTDPFEVFHQLHQLQKSEESENPQN